MSDGVVRQSFYASLEGEDAPLKDEKEFITVAWRYEKPQGLDEVTTHTHQRYKIPPDNHPVC